MVGIYKIESPSGKVYIGQSWNIESRIKHYIGVSCKNQVKLYNSVVKYGWINHSLSIVHELPPDISQDILDNYEQFYMDCYRDCGIKLLNLKEAGSHGRLSFETKERMRVSRTGKKHSMETLKKMSKSQIGNKNGSGNKGIKRTEETKLKLSVAKKGKPTWTGKNHTEESKLKMSKSQRGNQNAKGAKRSPETLEKMRLVNIGRKHSEITKQKMKDTRAKRTKS